MNPESTTQIQRVSNWIARLKYEDIPEDVIYYSKLQLLDSLAAICAGSRSDVGVKLKAALKASESGGPVTLLPDGESWSLDHVLYYHTAMITALEMDDFVFMGHVGQSASSVPLAMGQKLNVSGKDLLVGVIASAEVSGRLSAYLVNGPHQGHMRAFLHRAGAAVAASKISGYGETVIAQAMAIALSMPEFPLFPASFSPDTKVICTSAPTVEGVKAAYMAAAGMDGPLDIIENPLGLFAYFSYMKFIPDIWKWIGKTWNLRTLSVKKYATCGYAQGSVQAAIELKRKHPFDLDDISRVNIYVPLNSYIMEDISRPHLGASLTPVNTHFSNIRSVAAALIYGEITGNFYRAGTFEAKATEILKMVDRISLHHSWKLTISTMRGLYAGIDNAGKPGFLGSSAFTTMSRLRKSFGGGSLLGLIDFPQLAKVPRADLWYFFSKNWLSFSGYLFRSKARKAQDRDSSHEGYLDKMQFNFSGSVEIIFKDGRKVAETCMLPPGFASDPNRDRVIQDKFIREATPVWGESKSLNIKEIVLNIEKYTVAQLYEAVKQG